jgi:hypothetical protein
MTGRAAAALGLADRGILSEGQAADVVLFDPTAISDRSTYDNPHRYPAGIGTVIVNGTVVIDGGEHTGALTGRLLRRRGTRTGSGAGEGVQLHLLKASTESEIDAAFVSLVQRQAGALLIATDPFFGSRRELILALATRHAVPAMSSVNTPWLAA